MALATNQPNTIKSIMKSIYTGDTPFELTVGEMGEYMGHCNILKGLSALSTEHSKILQKNVVILTDALQAVKADGERIEERREDLNERVAREGDSETIRVDRKAVKTETKEFNEKQHKVKLFTVPEDAFPKDKDKFGMKKSQSQFGVQEFDRYESFLELLGKIIIEK